MYEMVEYEVDLHTDLNEQYLQLTIMNRFLTLV